MERLGVAVGVVFPGCAGDSRPPTYAPVAPDGRRCEPAVVVAASARAVTAGRNTLTRKIQELGLEPELKKGAGG